MQHGPRDPDDDDDNEIDKIDYSTWDTNDLRDKSQIDDDALAELNERTGHEYYPDGRDDDD